MYRFWSIIIRHLVRWHNRHPSTLGRKLVWVALRQRMRFSPLYK